MNNKIFISDSQKNNLRVLLGLFDDVFDYVMKYRLTINCHEKFVDFKFLLKCVTDCKFRNYVKKGRDGFYTMINDVDPEMDQFESMFVTGMELIKNSGINSVCDHPSYNDMLAIYNKCLITQFSPLTYEIFVKKEDFLSDSCTSSTYEIEIKKRNGSVLKKLISIILK